MASWQHSEVPGQEWRAHAALEDAQGANGGNAGDGARIAGDRPSKSRLRLFGDAGAGYDAVPRRA